MKKANPFAFVILIGVLSFFADFAYEGARSVAGPFLALLGAGAVVVSSIGGFGELLGYGISIISGPLAMRTRQYWGIALVGYGIQLSAVPLLTFARTWPEAAGLIFLERIGRAIRNPPRDTMLSFAAKEIGYGWGFGVHEALDQAGALVGPLVVALILVTEHSYREAFAALTVPVACVFILLGIARHVYPRPLKFDDTSPTLPSTSLPRVFWIYLIGAGLVAAGFADFALISYHLVRHVLHVPMLIPIVYSVAMAVSGGGSLLFGRLFDRFGFRVLLPLTLVSAAFAPLVFLGGFWVAIFGAAIWGLGIGVHESIIPAAVSTMVSPKQRAFAFGIFTGVYGAAWFAGSVVIGLLYGKSLVLVVAFCIIIQITALPIFAWIARQGSTVNAGEG